MPAHPSNQWIDRLPVATRKPLLSHCEVVQLSLSQVLVEAGSPALHVYFPIDSFISLVAHVDQHPGLEVGMVGREGVVGVQLALGVATAPLRAVVQGEGACWRIGAPAFSQLLASQAALRADMGRYTHALMAQMATSAGCLRYHLIGQRLARWLLMSQDRAQRPQFHVTHEFLAYMLGVRRVGITVAAGGLKKRGLIRYHRGLLTVLDRPGLEAAACSCYATDCRIYAASMQAP